jgi:hypothetical protein
LAYDGAGSLVFNFNDISPWRNLDIDLDEVFKTYTNDRLLRGTESVHPTAKLMDRKLADECFLALATSYFGHDHHQKGVVERGFSRYGAALSGLHAALSDPNRSATYDILESVILMTLFETLMSNNKDGWVTHALGLQRLFEVRGPESFQRMPERAVFQVSRPTIAFASMILRQPTILAEDRWKTVPWLLDPEEKGLYHHMVDILLDCPSLLCIKDEANALPDPQAKAAALQAFMEQAHTRLAQLQDWKNLWDTTERNAATEIPADTDVPQYMDGTPAWTTSLTFPSMYEASALTLYHATFIHLRRMLHNLHGPSTSLPISSLPLSIQEEYESGLAICRSVGYHLSKAREGEGSFSFMFPLRMAWEAVENVEPAVGEWLQGVLGRIGSGPRGRWAVAGYLLDTEEIPQGPRKRV